MNEQILSCLAARKRVPSLEVKKKKVQEVIKKKTKKKDPAEFKNGPLNDEWWSLFE